MTERVVLAYSGGLDTSVAIGWIAEETGAEVIAVAVDVGQGGEDLDVIRQRALDCGAVEAEVADARDEFADEYCLPALQANALYMDRYPLVSALSRPVIVKHLVAAARKHGATTSPTAAPARATTRCGSRSASARSPRPQVHRAGARLRHDPRQGDRASPRRRACRSTSTKKSPYSIDQNVWGRAVETGFLEDIWNAPDRGRLRLHRRTRRSRGTPTRSSSRFEAGVPVAIDGRPVTMLQAIEELNRAPARRASAGSTWSRTGWSASRAARSTRRPARSR